MPTIAVSKPRLFLAIGKDYTDEQFDDLCFDFGIELDQVTTAGALSSAAEAESTATTDLEAGDGGEVFYKIEVAANRYDLLCLEGLADAIKAFNGTAKLPQLSLSATPHEQINVTVKATTSDVRPFFVSAVVRNVSLDATSLRSFIDLQDKLHQNICSRRRLVAIGTHDLDKLAPPFRYEAKDPSQIRFVALNQATEKTAVELMQMYESHQQLKAYLPIIRDKPKYPIIYDSKDKVISMPPIINGNLSKMTVDTSNVFIDVTAIDLTKAEIVLNTLLVMLTRYSSHYTAEPVRVTYEATHGETALAGKSFFYPDLKTRNVISDVSYIQRLAGLPTSCDAEAICSLLSRMGLESKPLDSKIVSIVPSSRSDILHPCDVAEDAAISFGYNNVQTHIPRNASLPRELPINHLTDLIRMELKSNFYECLTFSLCSLKENFDWLKSEPSPSVAIGKDLKSQYERNAEAVVLASPKTREFECIRTSLLPMLLKTVAANKHRPPPVRLFEVSDVCVLADGEDKTGAINVRRVATSYSSSHSGFEVVHGALHSLLTKLNLRSAASMIDASDADKKDKRRIYKLRESNDPAMFPGRQANVYVGDLRIGMIGVVHPEVLFNFEVDKPTSVFEINLEPFLDWLEEN